MGLYRLLKRVSAWLRRSPYRRGKALGLALLGVCATGSRAAADPQEQAKGITISLGADDLEYSDTDQTAVLVGDVTLRARGLPGGIPEVEVDAQRIMVSLKPGDIVAPGRTVVRAPGLELEGDEVRYNLRNHDFHAENARTAMVLPLADHEVTLFAKSESIDATGGNAELRRAWITTCEREHPHYAIGVRKAQIVPSQDRLSIYGGTVELYGLRMPALPRINQSLGLREDRGAFDLAFPGYSSVYGWYYPVNRRLTPPDEPFQTQLNLRLTQNSVVAGRVRAGYTRGGFETWVTTVRREQREDNITQRLLYDALPEVGASLARPLGPGTVTTQLSGGYYRERNMRTLASAAGAGATLRVGWDWKQELPAQRAEMWAGVSARGSLYAGGDAYRTVDLEAGGSRKLWRDARGELGLRHHFIGGRTPFTFDDIDIQTEAFGELRTPLLGPFGLTVGGRYDINEWLLRDYNFGLHYRQHCLTWTLTYARALNRIGVGVNLTDFTFGGRPRPQNAPPPRAPRPSGWSVWRTPPCPSPGRGSRRRASSRSRRTSSNARRTSLPPPASGLRLRCDSPQGQCSSKADPALARLVSAGGSFLRCVWRWNG
jgi:lipopolysaccharide export system protein LptA